jgi:hypothetical protein
MAAAHSNPTLMRQVLRGIVLVGCTGTSVRVKLIAAWNSKTITRLPPRAVVDPGKQYRQGDDREREEGEW